MKRLLSVCAAVCMLFSFLCVGGVSYAVETGNADEMKNVLTQVKGKINVPDELEIFNYRYITDNDGDKWVFDWQNENGNKYMSVTADQKGRITAYNSNQISQKRDKAPNFTCVEAQEKAASFLAKAVPEKYPYLDKKPEVYSGSDTYSFTYHRYENGVICRNQQISVSVSSVTGSVQRMYANWLHDIEFKKITEPITESAAEDTWKKNIELELKYLYKYNHDDSDEAEAYLAYIPINEIKPIDAETGEIIEKEYEWVYESGLREESVTMDSAMSGGASNAAPSAPKLSDEELKKIAELDGLLTLAQVDRRVREITQLSLSSEYRISRSNLITRRTVTAKAEEGKPETEYSWQIVYAGPTEKEKAPHTIYAYVNAKTGELESYSDYDTADRNKTKPEKVTEKQAKAIAGGFIRKVNHEKAASVLEVKSVESKLTKDNGIEVVVGWNMTFDRGNEGIPVDNDGLSVSVNRMTGKVTRYNCTWQENVSFESADNVITAEEAVETFVEKAAPEMEYHIFTTYMYDVVEGKTDYGAKYYGMADVKNKKSTILVYVLNTPSGILSAKTGEYVDMHSGEKSKFNGYSDIGGHFAQREITLLADVGILPQTDEFMPYKNISQAEFLEYLYKSDAGYLDVDRIYEIALENGVITKAEVNRTAAVTRYQAISYIVRYIGLGKLAADSSAFRVSFADAAAIPAEYIGSVAIGKSMQIIGGSGGRFNGERFLTKGEAAMMVYNYMKN